MSIPYASYRERNRLKMELTEKERLMLTKKKEEICGLTLKILDMSHDREKILEIEKDFTTIISLLNQIADYSNTKHNLDELTKAINMLFLQMEKENVCKVWHSSKFTIKVACNYINSVKFDFTKRDLKINIPKIDLSLFKMK
jgi:hypothetical protein